MKNRTLKGILAVIIGLFLITNISAISIIGVSNTPEKVKPGENFVVEIEIENILDYDVKNINVKLDLGGEGVPFAPYKESSEKSLDELKEGEDEVFKFELIALPEADSLIYKIPVEITYYINDTKEEPKRDTISIIVSAEPELKIFLEDSEVLIRGRENILSINLINSGLGNAKFVYLTANDVSGIRFIGEKEQYLGDIDSDDFDNVEYRVYISENADIINLPIKLNFRDSTNKLFTEIKTISLRTYSFKEAQNLGLIEKPNYTLYIVSGIITAGYFGYRIIKRRKRKKKMKGR